MPPGKMPRNSIRCHIDHCPPSKQDVVFDVGEESDEPNEWNFIHRFDPIPRNLLLLGLNTVKRTETILQLDAYTRDREFYEMKVYQEYRHKKMTIEVYFHRNRACTVNDCEAVRINASGVIKMPLEPVEPSPGQPPGIRLKIKKPFGGDRYRISWRYPPLAA